MQCPFKTDTKIILEEPLKVQRDYILNDTPPPPPNIQISSVIFRLIYNLH